MKAPGIFLTALLLTSPIARANSLEEFNRSIWVGNAFDHLNRTGNIAYWWSLNIINEGYSKQTSINEDDIRKSLKWFRWYSETEHKTFASASPVTDQFDFANRVYDALKDFSSLNKLVGDFLQKELTRTVDSPTAQLQRWQMYNKDFYNAYASTDVDRMAVLSGLYDIARRNNAFAKVLDEVFGIPIFNAKIDESGQQILSENPDFAENKEIQDLVNGLDTLNNTVKHATNNLQNRLISIEKSISQTNGVSASAVPAENVSSGFDVLLERQRKLQEQEKDRFEMEGLRSSLFVLTSLIADKRTAQQLNAIGNAIINFKTVTDQFNTAFAGGSQASTMASAMLSMNYAAIFFSLVESFGKTGPSADEVISGQIKELALQLAERPESALIE
jgi:hypothetical protein